MKFEKAFAEVVELKVNDIITTSGCDDDNDGELDIV